MSTDLTQTDEEKARALLELTIQVIEHKMTAIRQLALFADRDAKQALKFCEMAAPFFREHGLQITKILRQVVVKDETTQPPTEKEKT